MQDRVPLHPGRVKLTPVAGQENTYDMTRADEPTQEGTPLNKATLLKDATAALYGLGADAVPDDVFAALTTKIGDIKVSARTDLSNNWLLCNGAAINKHVYPELYNVLHAIDSTPVFYSPAISATINIANITCMHYYNGIYLTCDTGGTIYASRDKTTWSEVHTATKKTYFDNIKFINGYYIAVGGNWGLFAYATNPFGTWSEGIVNNYNGTYTIDVVYGNNSFVFLALTNNYNVDLYYTSSLTSSSWTKVSIVGGSSYRAYNLFYSSNCFWITTVYESKTRIYKLTSLTASSVLVIASTSVAANGDYIMLDSKIVQVGTSNFEVFYVSASSNTATSQVYQNPTGFTATFCSNPIIANNKVYTLCSNSNLTLNNSKILQINILDSSLTAVWADAPDTPTDISRTYLVEPEENDALYSLLYQIRPSGLFYSIYSSELVAKLPTITLDRAYAYIRAKLGG